MYACQILADSVGPHGYRLTTFEVTFPRIVLADITRHRMLSYSFESTRAVPLEARLEQVKTNPFIPSPFRSRAKGMGGGVVLTGDAALDAKDMWLAARDHTLNIVGKMEPYGEWPGVSKELAGRLLEPFSWVTGIISGTTWDNMFGLRCPPEGAWPDPKYPAQFELQVIADMMRKDYGWSRPKRLAYGDWHLPLVNKLPHDKGEKGQYAAAVSAGRCASVSYLNHHKIESNTAEIAHDRWESKLAPSAHWSPGEHPAQCVVDCGGPGFRPPDLGNFRGFKQLRKFYDNEAVYEA